MNKIPKIDSIDELAKFWDEHDDTDFEDELEEVGAPTIQRKKIIPVPLAPEQMEVAEELAQSKGISLSTLVQQLLAEQLGSR